MTIMERIAEIERLTKELSDIIGVGETEQERVSRMFTILADMQKQANKPI